MVLLLGNVPWENKSQRRIAKIEVADTLDTNSVWYAVATDNLAGYIDIRRSVGRGMNETRFA